MDINPVMIETPYYKNTQTSTSLMTLSNGMVVSFQPECEKEETLLNRNESRFHLVLYTRSSCPYCADVTNYLKKEGKEIRIIDVENDKNAAREMVKIGGKNQVPCLMINGEALYESSDIIHWLETHKDQY